MTESARRDECGPERELTEEVLSDPSAYAAQLAQSGPRDPVTVDHARLRSVAERASSWKPHVERSVALAELSDLLAPIAAGLLRMSSEPLADLTRAVEVVGLGERPDRLAGIELTELVDRVERAQRAGDEQADYGLVTVKWAADVQLRICSNSLFWTEFRERVGARPLSGKAGANALVYAVTEQETVVLAPRALYEEVRATRAALAACRTWGDARARLSAERLAELRELKVVPADPGPADDAPLDPDNVTDGRWPSLHYGAMADWLPEAVVRDFGTEYSTMLDSGINFDAQSVRALLAALREAGFSCDRRPQLAELFDEWL